MNAEIGRVGFADRATRQSRSRQGVSASEYPIAQHVDLSTIIRTERIANIHWDALLDRFSVTFTNGTMGLGGSVGEALGDARRRSC